MIENNYKQLQMLETITTIKCLERLQLIRNNYKQLKSITNSKNHLNDTNKL
jgi:hypothetical protein